MPSRPTIKKFLQVQIMNPNPIRSRKPHKPIVGRPNWSALETDRVIGRLAIAIHEMEEAAECLQSMGDYNYSPPKWAFDEGKHLECTATMFRCVVRKLEKHLTKVEKSL